MTAKIGFIGGTGPEGKGLAARLARAGHEVIVGSRSAERGAEAAAEVLALVPNASVRGADNAGAARDADIVVVTVPYSAQKDTLSAIEDEVGDKILVSTVVPLQFSRARVSVQPVEAGSAAEEAKAVLPRARVVAAFHNLSASHLIDLTHPVEGDVVVCADDADALQAVIELANAIPDIRGLKGGPLANSRLVEGLTALILNLNRLHKVETAVKFLGL